MLASGTARQPADQSGAAVQTARASYRCKLERGAGFDAIKFSRGTRCRASSPREAWCCPDPVRYAGVAAGILH